MLRCSAGEIGFSSTIEMHDNRELKLVKSRKEIYRSSARRAAHERTSERSAEGAEATGAGAGMRTLKRLGLNAKPKRK